MFRERGIDATLPATMPHLPYVFYHDGWSAELGTGLLCLMLVGIQVMPMDASRPEETAPAEYH